MSRGLLGSIQNFITPAGSFGRRDYVICHMIALGLAAWHLTDPSEEGAMYAATAIVTFAAGKRLRDLDLWWDLSLVAGALFMAAWHKRGFDVGNAGIFVILTLHMTTTYLLSGLRSKRMPGTTKNIRSNA